jgi:hypothetical protein
MPDQQQLWTQDDEAALCAVQSAVLSGLAYVGQVGNEGQVLVPKVVLRLLIETAKTMEFTLKEIRDACPPF